MLCQIRMFGLLENNLEYRKVHFVIIYGSIVSSKKKIGVCLTSELYVQSVLWPIVQETARLRERVTWVRPRFEPLTTSPHDLSSGGDSVYCLSAIPSIGFRCNSFSIISPSPMLIYHNQVFNQKIVQFATLCSQSWHDPLHNTVFFHGFLLNNS